MSQPGLSVGLVDLLSILVRNLLSLVVLVLLLLERGVLSDGGVSLGVELLEVLDLGGLESLVPLGEVSVVSVLGFFLEVIHVSLDVVAEDVVSQNLGLPVHVLTGLLNLASLSLDLFLGLRVTGESLVLMGDVETSVNTSLEGSVDLSTGGGSLETDIEEALEGSSLSLVVVDIVVFSIGLLNTLVHRVHANLGEESSGGEETSAVSSRVVGETSGDTVSVELGGGGLGKDLISSESGIDNLDDDLGVGSSDDESVLLGVVLVLVLLDESSSHVVVGLALSSSLVLDLVSGGVCLVLDNLYESHLMY